MPQNIQLNDANFSLGPSSGFFYSCSYSLQALIQVEADGTVVNTFPVSKSRFRMPITELHYDGTFFWTLEDLPSSLGVVIKRWRLWPYKTAAFHGATPVEFRWYDELTLIHAPLITWSSEAFAIEHYHREFENTATQGASIIRLNDVSDISIGDTLYLGPSDFGGFEGNEEQIQVTGINSGTGDVTFSKAGGLENSFLSLDPIDFVKTIFLFNDHSFSGQEDSRGTLVRFSYPRKTLVQSDVGGAYNSVMAADFHEGVLSWVRAFQIMELDLTNPTFDFSASQESNLVEDNKTDLIEVYDLISDLDNDQYLKLQDRETTENIPTGLLTTTSFGGKYSFQSQATLPFVNSINMSFDTRYATPFPSSDKIQITAEVRDQFNLPVSSETIQFSAAINAYSDPGIPGTFSPSAAVTNTSGIAETTYTPSSTPTDIIVDVTSQVQ